MTDSTSRRAFTLETLEPRQLLTGEPLITGALAGQAVNDNSTVLPFAPVTISDTDSASLIIEVQLSDAARGLFTPASLSTSGFADAGSGRYLFTGSPTDATTAIRQLSFDPTDNRVAVGLDETTGITITADDSVNPATVDTTTTVIATGINDAPTIGGATAGQAVNDNATIAPFTGVTIQDVDPGQTLATSVTLDTAAKGAFTPGSLAASGFADAGGGVYTFSGSAAASEAAIRQLVFAPTEGRVPPGSTETTTFTISVDDSIAAAATNSTTTVVSTAFNDATTITGVVVGQAVNDNATISPFSGVTIGDGDPAQILNLFVVIDVHAKGTFTPASIAAGGFSDFGDGTVSRQATAAQVTAAIRALVFDPANDRVAVGATETTQISILIIDDIGATATNLDTTVISTSVNDAPAITGATAGQAVNENDTVAPFAGVTISDPDPSTTLSLSVTLDTAAKGAFTAGSLAASGFIDAGGGVYTFSGTPNGATTAVRQLVFNPADNRVAIGGTETTTFTILADDTHTNASDATTTVVSTSINDVPAVTGTLAAQAVADNATVLPFAGVSIIDADDPAQTLSITVSLDTAAKGAFTPASLSASGFADAGGGVYTFSGAAGAATAAIRQLDFAPTESRVMVGQTETTTFTITADDGIAPATINTDTTVICTPFNEVTTVTGTVAGQATADTATLSPFQNVTIADTDSPVQTLTIAVILADATAGVFTTESLTASGFVSAGGGAYTFTGTAAQATTAIRQLVFNPADNRVGPNASETISLGIEIEDGFSSPVADATTTVISTNVNDAPVITGAVAGQSVNDNATINPFAGMSISDADPDTTLTVLVTIDNTAHGAFTPASLTAAGFADGGGGLYVFTGSPAQATTAVRALVFDPIENRGTVGESEQTVFTVSTSDGIADDVSDSTTSVNSVSINDASTITGAESGQTVLDNATTAPFTGVTIADVDPGQMFTISVTLSDAAQGTFTPASLAASGFTPTAPGVFSRSASAADATTAIRQLVFSPTPNAVAVGQTQTTTLTISVDDGSGPVNDNTTTIVATSINDASSVTGAIAGQAVNDNAAIAPFAALTIADVDPAQTFVVRVTLSAAANGQFTPASLEASGFTPVSAGVYSFTGTAAAASTAIRQLSFQPTANMVAPGQTQNTTMAVTVNDGTSTIADVSTTVVATSINDAPTISGADQQPAVNDNSTALPFAGITFTDADPAAALSVTVTLDTAAKGSFTTDSLAASGFADAGGVYTFTGTPAAATAAIRALVFDPTENRSVGGQTETVIFTITASDGIAAAATDDDTTMVIVGVNEAPAAEVIAASLDFVRTGQTFVLTAAGVEDTDGAITAVRFFHDTNRDGAWDDGDELLAEDSDSADGWSYTATASQAWGVGTLNFFARCVDNDGAISPAAMTQVAVDVNHGPLVATVTPNLTSATYGQRVTVTATGVSAGTATVKQVIFYVDTNGNGVWDSRDKKLGTDSKASNGFSVSFVVPTKWALGNTMFFARANASKVGLGDAAAVRFRVNANTGPTIDAIVANPTSLPSTRKITLSAPSAIDSDGIVKRVEYFADSNFNGIFDAADKKFKTVSSSRNGWGGSVTVNRAWINSGSVRFFARAVDNNKLAGTVVTLSVPVAG